MKINEAQYLTSAVDRKGLLEDGKTEIAIAGRSNVGKSSFINFITDNKKLCRTSAEPGRTRMINYFEINSGEFYLVDLPGYGYARASHEERNRWAVFINEYFSLSKNIANVFVLVDLRHPPQKLDIQLTEMLMAYNLPFTVIGTKADKLKKNQIQGNVNEIAIGLRIGADNIIVTSSAAKTGRNEVLKRIEQIVTYHKN